MLPNTTITIRSSNVSWMLSLMGRSQILKLRGMRSMIPYCGSMMNTLFYVILLPYVQVQEAVSEAYKDKQNWNKMCLVNIANAGYCFLIQQSGLELAVAAQPRFEICGAHLQWFGPQLIPERPGPKNWFVGQQDFAECADIVKNRSW